MLIEKVIDHYVEIGKKHPGNPFRLSNSGRCARALAYQRFPSTFKPEPMRARVLMVLEEGKRMILLREAKKRLPVHFLSSRR